MRLELAVAAALRSTASFTLVASGPAVAVRPFRVKHPVACSAALEGQSAVLLVAETLGGVGPKNIRHVVRPALAARPVAGRIKGLVATKNVHKLVH